MPNTILKPDVILKDMAREFVNQTPTVQSLNPTYDDAYEAYGAGAGDQLRLDLPVRFTARTGMTRSNQDYIEKSATLVRSEVFGVDIEFTQKELGLEMRDFQKRVVKPMIATVASEVEKYVQRIMALGSSQAVTLPVSAIDRDDILSAVVLLDDASAPEGVRYATLTPKAKGQLLSGNASLFNPSADVSRQYLSGNLGDMYGLQTAVTSCSHTITRGTANGSYLINGAVSSGTGVTVDTGTGTLSVGDKFTVAGVFTVNPITKTSTGTLKMFTVASAYAGGTGTIAITEEIITTGPYQNVSTALADNAAITVFGSSGVIYPINLAYTASSCAFGSAAMAKPRGAAVAETYRAGNLAFSLTSDYDIDAHKTKWRFDILCGAKVVMPEQIIAIHGV